MTISADNLAKISSTRYMLVRIEPARFIGDDLASIGGDIYQMTFPFEVVARVTRNGIDLVEVASFAALTLDSFFHDESTGVLSVMIDAAPSDDDIIVAYHWIFYTSGLAVVRPEDPEDDATTERQWLPRLSASPKVAEGFKNITSGIFTFEQTQFSIVNVDHEFEQYLGPNDSFYQKRCTVWIVVNDDVSLLYVGRSSQISLSGTSATLTLFDDFTRLNQPMLLGDSPDEAYWFLSTESFPDMHPPKSGMPIRYVFGSASPNSINGMRLAVDGIDGYLSNEVTEEAVCTDWDPGITTSNNRVWGICRVSADGLKTLDFGTEISFNSGLDIFDYVSASDDNLEIGDRFAYQNPASPVRYATITTIIQNYLGSGNRFIAGLVIRGPGAPVTTPIGVAYMIPNSDPIIWVDDRTAVGTRDFTTSVISLPSGNKYIYVTFLTTAETTIANGGAAVATFNPDSTRVTWVVRTADTGLNHADSIQKICTLSGIDAFNAASFASAKAALTAKARFTIPYRSGSNVETSRFYLEDILGSTFGFLRFNGDREVEYQLLSSAPSGGATRDASLNLKPSDSVRIDYEDVATRLFASNVHVSGIASGIDANASGYASEKSNKARYLHDVVREVPYPHVLDDISDRLPYIMAVRGNRRAVYQYSTAALDIETRPGDEATLDSDVVLGDAPTIDLKVTRVSKGEDSTTIEATDLLGLT